MNKRLTSWYLQLFHLGFGEIFQTLEQGMPCAATINKRVVLSGYSRLLCLRHSFFQLYWELGERPLNTVNYERSSTSLLGIQRKIMLRYLIMAIRTPQFQPSVIEAHLVFLERLRQQGNLELAGPFTDKTGGAYVIKAANLDEAKALAFADPVHLTKSSVVTVYEWNAK